MFDAAEFEDESLEQVNKSQSRRLYVLSCLTGIPFFLHGYFPVVLLLLLKGGTQETNVSDQLLSNLTRGGVSLWPYCAGVLFGVAASAELPDRYGRRATMLSASWLLSAVLLFLTVAPSAVVGNAGVRATMPEHETKSDEFLIIQELQYSFNHISSGELFGFLFLGFLVSLIVQTTLLFVVETSKASLRGTSTAECTRQGLLGVATACLAATLFAPFQTDDEKGYVVPNEGQGLGSVSHALEFRGHYAVPLVLTVAVATGLLMLPESPYWLLAQRTPAECIESLKKLRLTPSIAQEYEAMYHGASDEARRDSRWRSLLTEYPSRYVINLGVMLQSVFLLGGIQLFVLQGHIFLRLCGLYPLPSPAISTDCSPSYEVLTHIVHVHRRLDDSYAPVIPTPPLPFGAADLTADYHDMFSIGGLGCLLAMVACVLGTYAASGHLRRRGERRIQLIASMVGMCMCLLMLAYILSGSSSSRLLNFNSSVGLQRYLSSRQWLPPGSADSFPNSNLVTNNTTETGSLSNYGTDHSKYKGKATPSPTTDSTASDTPTLQPSSAPQTDPPSAAPSSAPAAAPTAPRPALPSIYSDYGFEDSVKTSRVVVFLCVILSFFFFSASISVLSWLVVAESFPMRIRAKGSAVVFGISAVLSAVGYAVLRRPAVVPVLNGIRIVWHHSHETSTDGPAARALSDTSASVLTLLSSSALKNETALPAGEPSELLCFEQWVHNSGAVELHVLLFCCAVMTLIFAVYFFLALPETDGKMLTDMDELYDVCDFDLCMGCYPHGQASGFLGIRMGHGLTRDFVTTPTADDDPRTPGGMSGAPSSDDGDFSPAHFEFSFIPDSAFDSDYTDIDMAQKSAADQSLRARVKLGWVRTKNFFFPESKPMPRAAFQTGEVFENNSLKYLKKRSSASTDYLRELTGEAQMWDDWRAPRPDPEVNAALLPGSNSSKQSAEKPRSSASTTASPVVFYGSIDTSNTGSANNNKKPSNSRATPKKYSLSNATFQFDAEDRDEDAYYF